LVAEDAKTFIPRVSEKLLRRASRRLRDDIADDFYEEWLAHLNEQPELLAKFYHATSLYFIGSRVIASEVGYSNSQLMRKLSFTKRAIDVLASISLIPLLLILTAVVFSVNRATKSGPVFYERECIGLCGKRFTQYKFRTFPQISSFDQTNSFGAKANNIHPIYVYMRKSRIDEIPQILNILRGDMTLVGPKPWSKIPANCDQYLRENFLKKEDIDMRLSVKPGVSGLAQNEVGYVSDQSSEVRSIKADNYYIRNRSIKLELWIIWRVIASVFRDKL
jgi:lipopolysaccharide/colanic/teichoic acid biosynthesis glycosyltransferase